MLPIIYACIVFTLLAGPSLHLIGFRWRAAWLTAAILAAGVGWSAADAAGLF